MILNKKGLAVLPLVALLFTSCAKNVSYEEACKFVRENYTETTPKTPKSGTFEFQGRATDEETKALVIAMVEAASKTLQIEIKLDNNLHAKVDITPYALSPLSEAGIVHPLDGQKGVDFTYTIKGKNFTQSTHAKSNDSSTGGKVETWISQDYNDKGFLTKSYAKEVMKQDKQEVGMEQTTRWVF